MFLFPSSLIRLAGVLTVPLVIAVLYPAPAWSQEVDGAAASLAITPVTVIDVQDGVARSDRTVVIEGERITAVGPAASVEIPAGAHVVDGTGKYLIPGLWDMHTHLLWTSDASEHSVVEMSKDIDSWTLWERYYGPALDLLVANGVTGIRELWGDLEVVRRVREEAAAGERHAPRIVVAGHQVDGHPPSSPGQVVATTPAQGRAAVDSLVAEGAAFIKVYNHLTPDVYRAIAERAKELGVPFVGHVPYLVPATEVSEAGQRSIEHLTGIVQGCSTVERELIAVSRAMLEADADGESAVADSLELQWYERVLATQDGVRCRALLERLARDETWQTPTLTNLRGEAYQTDPAMAADPRMRFIHPAWRASWLPEADYKPNTYRSHTEERRRLRRRFYERKTAITGMAAEEGVPILAGTDTPLPFVFPGFGLHDELVLLVEAGLTPLEALQTSTLNPARYLEATDSLGTVEAGKLADLVLLDANPLEDISHTQEIAAVVLNGRYLDRAALDGLLAQAEAAAGASHDPRDPETVVMRQVEAYNAHDLDAFLRYYHEDATYYNLGPDTSYIESGKAALRESFSFLSEAPDGFGVDVTDTLVMGPFVVLAERLRHTPADGPGALVVYEVREGLIRNTWIHTPEPVRRSIAVEEGEWPKAELTATELERYAGRYGASGQSVTVALDDEDRLQLSFGGESFQLVPEGDHVFAHGRYEDGRLVEILHPQVRVVFQLEEGEVVGYELRRAEGGAVLRQVPRIR